MTQIELSCNSESKTNCRLNIKLARYKQVRSCFVTKIVKIDHSDYSGTGRLQHSGALAELVLWLKTSQSRRNGDNYFLDRNCFI